MPNLCFLILRLSIDSGTMENENRRKPVCAIVGVGPGIGAANAHKFAEAGYALALVSRSPEFINKLADKLEAAKAYACDVTNSAGIKHVFEKIQQDLGMVDVLVYSASSRFKAQGSFGNIEMATEEDMENA